MTAAGLHSRVTALLAANNASGPYHLSLVCTAQGLVVASAGDALAEADVAAFTCMFDDVLRRAVRDLGFGSVDEVCLLDPGRGRYVIRPLDIRGTPFFLVVRASPSTSWRRNTTRLVIALEAELTELVSADRGAA